MMILLTSCDQFKPADQSEWEGGYDDGEEGYYKNQKGDTLNPGPDYYVLQKGEEYTISCTITDSTKVIYRKLHEIKNTNVAVDSIKVDPQKNYTIDYYCKWEGARIGNSIQISTDKIFHYITLNNQEEGNAFYTDHIIPQDTILKLKIGILRSFQDIESETENKKPF